MNKLRARTLRTPGSRKADSQASAPTPHVEQARFGPCEAELPLNILVPWRIPSIPKSTLDGPGMKHSSARLSD